MTPTDSVPQLPFVEPRVTLVPAAEVAVIVQNVDLYYFSGTVQRSFLHVPAAGAATLFVRKLAERVRLETPLTGIVEPASPRGLPGLWRRSTAPWGVAWGSSSTYCP
ncbi:MAG: hypothetical protein NTX16_09965 [Actinobacteria bacterium]|nr:hypothetical protein [Actinomycetota bacterium]